MQSPFTRLADTGL